MCININNWEIFRENYEPISRISQYSHPQESDKVLTLVPSRKKCINFGKISELHGFWRKSCAGLMQIEDNIYFIEFKSNLAQQRMGSKLKCKIVDSLNLFGQITNTGMTFNKKRITYIVVGNGELKEESVKALESYKGFLYKDFKLMSPKEFKEFISDSSESDVVDEFTDLINDLASNLASAINEVAGNEPLKEEKELSSKVSVSVGKCPSGDVNLNLDLSGLVDLVGKCDINKLLDNLTEIEKRFFN